MGELNHVSRLRTKYVDFDEHFYSYL